MTPEQIATDLYDAAHHLRWLLGQFTTETVTTDAPMYTEAPDDDPFSQETEIAREGRHIAHATGPDTAAYLSMWNTDVAVKIASMFEAAGEQAEQGQTDEHIDRVHDLARALCPHLTDREHQVPTVAEMTAKFTAATS
ncbi:hypothetical protein [Nocardiopsis tropica]|uniref:Uncharacterized protein n=1 Tax=Nocardiopsis tropica TaxID=109330 RepID=A0ABU7KRN8_9ACTN|nr:hypothetical protein [Nocardiopsis umidischolae]MEE2051742.1 hypothetical protein [Nocardiopsis umidischolae]